MLPRERAVSPGEQGLDARVDLADAFLAAELAEHVLAAIHACRRDGRIELEWPPRSGRRAPFPEVDRVAWFAPVEARRRLKSTQVPLLDRLEELLALDAG